VIKIRFKRDFGRNNWPDIITELQRHNNSYNINIVRWIPPPINWVKCNTDGASRGNPGPSSAAFCIRDYSGSLVVAKGFKIHNTSNLVAEARAIREGLFFCKEHLLSHVIIETNSMAMVQILEGGWNVPWSVTLEVNSINCLRRSLSARVQHTFREGNTLADYFANLVFDFAGDYHFSHFQDIPMEGRRILNLDKSGTPHIRRRQMN